MSLQSLLSKAHPQVEAANLLTTTFAHKPLFLTATATATTTATTTSNPRTLRQTARRESTTKHKKPQPLSAREKRALGISTVPPDYVAPEVCERLHALWQGYMRELLAVRGGGGGGGVGAAVVGAELVGARMEVVRSRCPSVVGVSGVCVGERMGGWWVVDGQGKGRCVGKRGTVVRVVIGGGEEGVAVVEIYGERMVGRSGERAGKKFKGRAMVDL